MSEFSQQSFVGGINLLSDDTRLQPNQYRCGFNLRNRFDVLQPCLSSVEDVAIAAGVKQELTTFGNYVIMFVAGRAYYRLYSATGWKQIAGFFMSAEAPRFWTCPVPVGTMGYIRLATETATASGVANVAGPVLQTTYGAFQGNVSGLLVQDNLNQPQLLYIHPVSGLPVSRATQTYAEWRWDATSDHREYVPIGNSMAWVDGVLYIVSQDFNYILRSVSGRPLDFVINIDIAGQKGGDAYTTNYSVGIGGITSIRQMSNDALFVSAGNSNFSVSKNTTQNAPKIFGEYTFIRTFLFNATCLSDRAIFDSDGDTRFISLLGVRSFNAILQQQNEGRNSKFSLMIQQVLQTDNMSLVQLPNASAGILYDDYEMYALNTIFGAAIAVYDTLNKCWTSFDIAQTDGQKIKILAKIELDIQRLYAVTEDDRLFTLYVGPLMDSPRCRTGAISAETLKAGGYDVAATSEHRLREFHVDVSGITENMVISAVPYVNSRLTAQKLLPKSIRYTTPAVLSNNPTDLPDVNTQLNNVLFTFLNAGSGRQTYVEFTWTTGATIMGYDFVAEDLSPVASPLSQGVVK